MLYISFMRYSREIETPTQEEEMGLLLLRATTDLCFIKMHTSGKMIFTLIVRKFSQIIPNYFPQE